MHVDISLCPLQPGPLLPKLFEILRDQNQDNLVPLLEMESKLLDLYCQSEYWVPLLLGDMQNQV